MPSQQPAMTWVVAARGSGYGTASGALVDSIVRRGRSIQIVCGDAGVVVKVYLKYEEGHANIDDDA